MRHLLVFSAVGPNRPAHVEVLARVIRDAGCNILDSRMTVLGSDFAMICLVSGAWDAIAKIEAALPRACEQADLLLSLRRTEQRNPGSDRMPYAVEVVAIDHPGIVYDIAGFFTARDIQVEDMHSTTYAAAHTGAPMFSLHLTVSLSAQTSIAALRGEFMEFCDHLNLDAIIEPVK
ncbi:MAG TPA: glycine cleavage system protein R [Gammaproteobacteria bacterium]|nr:glycine cleavage system protein R [Gammaproteobacteria bacterium]